MPRLMFYLQKKIRFAQAELFWENSFVLVSMFMSFLLCQSNKAKKRRRTVGRSVSKGSGGTPAKRSAKVFLADKIDIFAFHFVASLGWFFILLHGFYFPCMLCGLSVTNDSKAQNLA